MSAGVRRLLWIAIAVFVLAGTYLSWRASHPELVELSVHPSPDGRHRVVVYRLPRTGPVMPGQGSDSPGLIRLEARDGRVLRETRVGMIREFTGVEWGASSVRIPMIDEWPLDK